MQFDFGKNWLDFSRKALTAAKVTQAQTDFEKLFQGMDLTGKTFLDIGFGQGLSLLIAKQKGSIVIGCDVNPKCQEALQQTASLFSTGTNEIPVIIGSILDKAVLQQLKINDNQQFDIVHSWGVLHHTGNMQYALQQAASLVKENGYLVISIYNRHWTSPIWRIIKWLYCHSPSLLQKGLIYLFYPIIWLAKYLVTGKNPNKMTRGMDFLYNVVDWVGGYPYEYASIEEIELLLNKQGLVMVKAIPSQVPTGCNEFVFNNTTL
ncbi:MAG: class I SAM-dependent methyltransferase [Thioploca sp.]|nr:class I SAM-dependent methyltransferase [Thioploca sp.]